MKNKKPTAPTVKVALTGEQLATLRSALDSWLYESAPENYRNSGMVVDPREDGDGKLDIEARGVVSLIDEHDAIEALLINAEKALAP